MSKHFKQNQALICRLTYLKAYATVEKVGVKSTAVIMDPKQFGENVAEWKPTFRSTKQEKGAEKFIQLHGFFWDRQFNKLPTI